MVPNDLRNMKLPRKFAVPYYAIWLVIGIILATGGIYYMLNPGHSQGNDRVTAMSLGWIATAAGLVRIVTSSINLYKFSKAKNNLR